MTARRDRLPAASHASVRQPLDDRLLEYATAKERQIYEAVQGCGGSHVHAADALGLHEKAVHSAMARLRKRAATRGWAPEYGLTQPTAPGFHLKGTTTLYDGDGNRRLQWVKTDKDRENAIEAFRVAVDALAEPIKGLGKPVKGPRSCDSDLLSIYPMGDPHVGMRSWSPETGHDFDLEIAEANLVTATDHLVGLSPPSKEGLIVNLGDYFHSDNQQNRTARSGNALDVDGRYAKVIRVGVRIMRRLIDRALEKHRHVTVICAIGNHDDHSALWLALCLENYYSREPRVTINPSPAAFHYYRFGECLIGVTHLHTVKPDKLPGIMANDRKEDWGETSWRTWLTGHEHHERVKEYPGCTVETFRPLAPPDAWAAAAGYRADQDMRLDVLHRKWGRINRYIVGVPEIRALQKKRAA